MVVLGLVVEVPTRTRCRGVMRILGAVAETSVGAAHCGADAEAGKQGDGADEGDADGGRQAEAVRSNSMGLVEDVGFVRGFVVPINPFAGAGRGWGSYGCLWRCSDGLWNRGAMFHCRLVAGHCPSLAWGIFIIAAEWPHIPPLLCRHGLIASRLPDLELSRAFEISTSSAVPDPARDLFARFAQNPLDAWRVFEAIERVLEGPLPVVICLRLPLKN